MLARHGYPATYRGTDEAEWERDLDRSYDLVVVAGGDGTVKRAGLALAGKDTTMAVLPTGTANNIALALGSVGSIEDVIASFRAAPRLRLVVGRARGPWGEWRFVEGVGFGVFARTMRYADEMRGDDDQVIRRSERLREDIDLLLRHTRDHAPSRAELWLDGELHRDEYILVSVMSIPSMGPRLELAPEADATESLFDVALVPASDRDRLEHHLIEKRNGRSAPHGALVRRARFVEARWFGSDVHVDDDVWPKKRPALPVETPVEVTIEATADRIEVLAPGRWKEGR